MTQYKTRVARASKYAGLVVAAGLFAVPAAQLNAQQASGEGVYKTPDECARIESDTLRLKCFDVVYAGGVYTTEVERETLRSEFGLERVDTKEKEDKVRAKEAEKAAKKAKAVERSHQAALTKAGQAETPDAIEMEIVKVEKSPTGRWVLTTSEGQVWRQTDTDWYKPSKLPFKVTIHKAILSSYTLMEEGKSSSIKVKRVK